MAPFPCLPLGRTHIEFLTKRWRIHCVNQPVALRLGSSPGRRVIGTRWIQADGALNLPCHSQTNAPTTTQLRNCHRAVTGALSHITGASLILWAIGPLRTAGPLLQRQLKSLSSEGEEKTGAALCQGISSWLTLGRSLRTTHRIWYLFWGAHYTVRCLCPSTALWTTFWRPENLPVATLDL